MKESFGEYIRKLRNQKGLTLTQLAAQLGIDSANLSKIENSKRQFDLKRIDKLAEIFKLKPEELVEECLSDQFAQTLYNSNCDIKVLRLAEEKVRYRTEKSYKQGTIKL